MLSRHEQTSGTNTVKAVTLTSPVSLFFLAVMTALVLMATPARSEILLHKTTEAQSHKMSSELKTYICSDEFSAPNWCAAYRKSKLTVSDRTVTRLPAKGSKKAAAEREAALVAPPVKTKEQLAREAAEMAEVNFQPDLEPEPDPELALADERAKAWKLFLTTADLSNLTRENIRLLNDVATLDGKPEAHEILGFAHSTGKGGLPLDLTEAYRQYGQAYLKGMKRVKTNLDRIWPKIPRDKQLALLSEFG